MSIESIQSVLDTDYQKWTVCALVTHGTAHPNYRNTFLFNLLEHSHKSSRDDGLSHSPSESIRRSDARREELLGQRIWSSGPVKGYKLGLLIIARVGGRTLGDMTISSCSKDN